MVGSVRCSIGGILESVVVKGAESRGLAVEESSGEVKGGEDKKMREQDVQDLEMWGEVIGRKVRLQRAGIFVSKGDVLHEEIKRKKKKNTELMACDAPGFGDALPWNDLSTKGADIQQALCGVLE